MAQSGYPQLTLNFWLGILAPVKTPANLVAKLNEDINASLNDDATRALMDSLGFELIRESPVEFAAVIANDAKTWKKVADSADLKLN